VGKKKLRPSGRPPSILHIKVCNRKEKKKVKRKRGGKRKKIEICSIVECPLKEKEKGGNAPSQ